MFAPEMIARLTLKRGQAWFDELQKARHIIIKVDRKYYESIIEELNGKNKL